MVSVLLFTLAGIILMVALWSLVEKRTARPKDGRSDYLKAAAGKLRDNVKSQPYIWRWLFQSSSERRRDYYRNEYLQSDAWKRKRYVVLRRDNWRCVYCGGRATQVHHKRYAKKNIGKEPIEWLVSICKPCHDSKHR